MFVDYSRKIRETRLGGKYGRSWEEPGQQEAVAGQEIGRVFARPEAYLLLPYILPKVGFSEGFRHLRPGTVGLSLMRDLGREPPRLKAFPGRGREGGVPEDASV